MRDDADADVADVTDNTEALILNQHKTFRAKYESLEKKAQAKEVQLNSRWKSEEEERKRKAEEEEENKFDYSSYLLESKKT